MSREEIYKAFYMIENDLTKNVIYENNPKRCCSKWFMIALAFLSTPHLPNLYFNSNANYSDMPLIPMVNRKNSIVFGIFAD